MKTNTNTPNIERYNLDSRLADLTYDAKVCIHKLLKAFTSNEAVVKIYPTTGVHNVDDNGPALDDYFVTIKLDKNSEIVLDCQEYETIDEVPVDILIDIVHQLVDLLKLMDE